LMEYYF